MLNTIFHRFMIFPNLVKPFILRLTLPRTAHYTSQLKSTKWRFL
ncbi:hypothetical protein GMES_3346 [Paraglaciecola mesophila KMM 241]|uniref:Uncharacterized protein n=1 Tax=Paraglaciecola mesophila KMM 241 TaxID=1128912 RepID=K6XYF2_9ALTE|nr:hypothetical protein GMES_3346 [Paraglaciecola mesophila KMM 241]